MRDDAREDMRLYLQEIVIPIMKKKMKANFPNEEWNIKVFLEPKNVEVKQTK